MANLKDIRDRIGSVKNTRKITEAMRLVAAAKVRRAQEQVLRSRPFADRLARILENLQSRMRFEDADAPLLEQRDVATITLLAVTGDRGLCGGYNANIIKRTELRYAERLEFSGVGGHVAQPQLLVRAGHERCGERSRRLKLKKTRGGAEDNER